MNFNQTDDINYSNIDNLNNNISSSEEISNTKSITIDKTKKDKATIERDKTEYYYNEIERYQTVKIQKECNHFNIDITNDFSSEQNLESIEDSRLVSSIKERIFGPDYFARLYWNDVEEYLQNGGDPDDF